MTFVLRSTKLPEELVLLLKSNLSLDKDIFNIIFEILKNNRSIELLLNDTFSFFDGEKRFLEMIRSLGWLHFRDRLTALYLNQIKDGHYHSQIDTTILNDLLILEQKLEDHTIQWGARSYLLGIYLTALKLSDDNFHFKIPNVVFDLLKVSRGRIEKIDWMVLTLWHFSNFLGDKKLHEAIVNERKTYQDLYLMLSNSQQKNMLENFLNYSYSIQDSDYFKDVFI